MPYNIENIFICLAAPFLLAALGTNTGNRKNYIFIVLGFVCCIISAYLNTFFSVLYGAQETSAVLEISPVIEETVKLIPLLFGLIVFELQPQEGDNMFNMLMKTNGLIKQFGYAVPIVSCLILFLLKYRFRKITDSK